MAESEKPPCGWPSTILQDASLATGFQCGKCEHLLINPCQIHGCGHRYCEPCIHYMLRDEKSVDCPTCVGEDSDEMQVITSESYLPDYACKRTLYRLHVVCPYKSSGCSFEGKMRDLEEHVRTCLYVITTCRCGMSIPRTELSSHIEFDCPHARDNRRCRFGCSDEVVNDASTEDHDQSHVVRHVTQLHDDVQRTKQITGEKVQHLASRVSEIETLRTQNAATTSSIGGGAPAYHGATEMTVSLTDPAFKEESRKNMKVMEEKTKVVHNLFGVLFKEVEQAKTRLLGLEKHIQQIVSEQEARVRELRSALSQSASSCNGTLLWEIEDVERKCEEARSAGHASILSKPFYTSRAGYKLCGRIYLNGDGIGRGQYLSLFIVMMKGRFDAILKWPFNQFVTLTLIDQSGSGQHVRDSFRTDPLSSSFRRPSTEMNIASGCPRFMKLQDLRTDWQKYVPNDVMMVEIKVDTQGLEDYGGQGI